MSELLDQLGINWKLLLAQAVNFLLLLFILKLTVYKPLLELLSKRRAVIEKGERDSALAEERLAGADALMAAKIKEGEQKSMEILSTTEKRGKELEASLLMVAKQKESNILAEAARQAKTNTEEERRAFFEEAAAIIKRGIQKTVEASPETIDDKLVANVVANLKKTGV